MTIFDKIKGLFGAKPIQDKYLNSFFFDFYNASPFNFSGVKQRDLIKKAYLENPHIKLITDWIVSKAILCITETGKFYEKQKDGSLILVESLDESLNEAVNKPYVFSFEEAIRLLIIYKLIEGEYFAYLKREFEPDNNGKYEKGVNVGKNRILSFGVFPSSFVNIIGGGTLKGIDYYMYTKTPDEHYYPESIYHSKFSNPLFENGKQLRGVSILEAAKNKIETDKIAQEAQGEIFENRGVNFIVSPDNPIPLDEAQLKVAREAFKENYTGKGKGGSTVFAPGKVNVHQLGKSPADLQLLEYGVKSMSFWCQVLNVSETTFGAGAGVYQNNLKEARKISVIDGVLPHIKDIEKFINHICKSYETTLGKEIVFKTNYKECFDECQDDVKTLAESLSKIDGLTLNQELKALGYAEIEDEYANEPRIRVGNAKVPMNIYYDNLNQGLGMNNNPNQQDNTSL